MRARPFTVLVVAVLLAGCVVSVEQGGTKGAEPGGTRGAAGASAPPAPELVAGANLTVHFIDVAQGDATLIVTPSGRTLLVDAGDRAFGDDVIAYLRDAGVTRLDAFVASHGHADHIGGVGVDDPERNVLHAVPAARVFEPGYPLTTLTYETFLQTVDATGAEYYDHRDFAPGDSLDLESHVTITFLHPDVVDASGDPNEESIVLRVAYGDFSVLLTGDAGAPAENEMLERDLPVASTVLKVGHHGSRSSTTRAWLDAVDPALAVISVGAENSYGHPHEDVLDRLRDARVDVQRTDENGSIVVTSNGVTWSVSSLA